MWKQYLVSAQEQYKHDLAVREQQFNIELIRQLKAESTKITLAKQLITNHVAVSKLFEIVQGLTAENVRFQTLDFITPADQAVGGYQLTLSGYGKDLTTVAFQAKVLNQMDDYGLRTVVRNPIFSNPAFNENGSISFSLSALVDGPALSYKNDVLTSPTSPESSTSSPQ